MTSNILCAFALSSMAAASAYAQPFDIPGRSETLPDPETDWVFVGTSLMDVSDDRFLGVVSLGGAGITPSVLRPAPDGSAIYAAETFRTRGNRGERTDVVTIFEPSALAVSGEVVIPPKRAFTSPLDGSAALTDDGRYLAVFNLTPAQSISVVNTETREFVGEIATPGCSLAFGAGDLSYLMICANGDLLSVELNGDGTENSKTRIQGFFDPEEDPLRENGVRYRDQLIFASFNGFAHTVDVSGAPEILEPWPLLSGRDRRADWHIAGSQNLAVHQGSGRLFSIVRESEEALDDPADFDGHEIWVYDIESQERVDRFEATPEREASGGGGGDIGASSGDGARGIVVTQGLNPRLVTIGGGGVSVRDATSGEYIHETLRHAPADGRLTLLLR